MPHIRLPADRAPPHAGDQDQARHLHPAGGGAGGEGAGVVVGVAQGVEQGVAVDVGVALDGVGDVLVGYVMV